MKRLAVLAALAAPCLASAAVDDLYPSMVVSQGEDLVLEHTSVVAEVQVGLAVVSVHQTFGNPHTEAIDATYIFPLPDEAAVRSMEITCGGRTIVGEIMTRDAARKTYEAARHEGRKAALLEQQRANVFTQEVASICPGETVKVDLEYVEQVHLDDGKYELVFPTTLGPRFDPRDLEEPPRVLPMREGRRIDISVDIDEGLPVSTLYSDTHAIAVVEEGAWGATVELAEGWGGSIPNKDFSLVWSLSGEVPRAAAVVHPSGEDEGYIAITLEPQILEDLSQQRKRELLFVLDASCSMQGTPWQTATSAVRLALTDMRSDDTFNLVKFSNAAGSLFSEPQPATPANLARAEAWLQGFEGGGTNMQAGIVHSLRMPGDPQAMRLVLFLTDGYIGNEGEIFRTVESHLGDARLFSLGVGSSVNRLLLEGLAEMGRGAAEYQLAGTPLEETVDNFYARIAHPMMTDIAVDFGGLEVYEQVPGRVTDLWAGQPVRVVAKYRGGGAHRVRITGLVDGEPYDLRLPIDVDGAVVHEGVSTLWARRKIHDLTYAWDLPDREEQIAEVALTHHLVSEMTSLVAVEETRSACGPSTRGVAVPSYQPEGVTGVGGLLGAGGIASRGAGIGGGGRGLGLGGLGTRGIGSTRSGTGSGGGSFGGKAVGSVAGDPIILGSLDRNRVDETIRRHLNGIRYCYQRELQKDPSLGGKLVIRFAIGADGTVTQAEVQSSTLNQDAVETCIVRRFERMRFPVPAGGIVWVNYPFRFSPE